MKAATTISGHLKDLGRRDIAVVFEVKEWLESSTSAHCKPRDAQRRTTNKRILNRLIASQLLIRAASGDVLAAKEVMDRTEGKVKDTLEITEFRSLSLTIDLSARNQTALEAVNQTLLGAGEPQIATDSTLASEIPGTATTHPAEPQENQHDPSD